MSETLNRSHSESISSDERPQKRVKRKLTGGPSRKRAPSSIKAYGGEQSSSDMALDTERVKGRDERNVAKKWNDWSAHATSTPYPEFGHPTNRECQLAYDVLYELHNLDVEAEFQDTNTPETIPFVLDTMIVAVLSQATSWSNAKRAMDSMKKTYGSVFAYEKIWAGGSEKLQQTIRCGGLHVRKTKIIMSILEEVKSRHGSWNLDHLLNASDEDAMKELISYKYIGTKSAFVVMGWCLKRNRFTVDTHVYRIAGLWGWRPMEATRESTQLHLDAVVPPALKFKLHFLLIQHGRTCPACRGGSKGSQRCEVQAEVRRKMDNAKV